MVSGTQRRPTLSIDAQVGNGSHPMSMPAQLGCCSVAPLRPHLAQRAPIGETDLMLQG
jgi:hypothetical protein